MTLSKHDITFLQIITSNSSNIDINSEAYSLDKEDNILKTLSKLPAEPPIAKALILDFLYIDLLGNKVCCIFNLEK